MEKPRSNVQRLRDEGYAIHEEIPAEYEEVIEGLSPDEVAMLVDVTRRLERAQAAAPDAGPYTAFFPPL